MEKMFKLRDHIFAQCFEYSGVQDSTSNFINIFHHFV